jgi:hypothetical protein
MPRRKVPEVARSPTTSDAPPVQASVAPIMTRRPRRTTRYQSLLRRAEASPDAEMILLSPAEWEVLLAYVPLAQAQPGLVSVLHEGRRWTLRPEAPAEAPTLDRLDVAPPRDTRRHSMTAKRRPSFQAEARYLDILDAIDAHNWAQMDITSSQWRALVECVPVLRCTPGHDADGVPILIIKDDYGLERTFYRKPPTGDPSGRGDLTTLIRDDEDDA